MEEDKPEIIPSVELVDLTFLEAIEEAGNLKRIRYKFGDWNEVLHGINECKLLGADGRAWWPPLNLQKEKAWQVEKERPRDIYLWVVRRGDLVMISYEQPYKRNPKVNQWWSDGQSIYSHCPLLWLANIPEDKPALFRLVPSTPFK